MLAIPSGVRARLDHMMDFAQTQIISLIATPSDDSEVIDRRRRTPKPMPPPAEGEADNRPALARRSPGKRQQGINFDVALLEYSREAVAYMGRRHPEEAGSESLAALIDQAVREKITAWERKYASGKGLPRL